MTATDLLQEMRQFRQTGSVLYVGAHPDDENNRLMPYLARGRALRTGYLSLTRGDGGQNLIGSELGAELGVIRTQELLAARRVDGGEQYFATAKDFGFSKDSADTLRRWDRQQVLADIVRVVRQFRPDVIITRFPPVPGGTHGHHTASAILAIEAFKLAGDAKAFPDQLATLQPWQPKRIVWNSYLPPGATAAATTLQLDAGGYDPLLGESFGEIGARGRSMHKSQGEGRTGQRGPAVELFELLAGEPMHTDIMDGVDTTWSRVPGGAEIGELADRLVSGFNPLRPADSVATILDLRRRLAQAGSDPLLELKRQQLDRVLAACLGLFVDTTVAQAQVVPGETLKLQHSAIVRTDVPVRWMETRYPGVAAAVPRAPLALALNQPATRDAAVALPASTPLTQPYWLRASGTEGMFRVEDASLIGRPENPPVLRVEHVFEVGGQTLVVPDEPVQVINDPVRGEIRRRLDVIPPVSLHWDQEVELIAPGTGKRLVVHATAARPNLQGLVRVEAPRGWTVSPTEQSVQLRNAGDRTACTFELTAPASGGTATLTASIEINGTRYQNARIELRYDHIPTQLLQPPAALRAVSFDLKIKGRSVGYVAGAGDMVADNIRQMGYSVAALAPAELTLDRLQRFDAVVIGVRAFNTRADLDAQMPALFAYAEGGGTVIVQYNTSNGLLGSRWAPFPVELSRDRVTDAAAPVTLLQPGHPALTTPNRITDSDFAGWVQERARFVPRRWDEHFIPLLSMHDPGEDPLTGTLLIAPYGKGHFVYTSLSWFRELPAGVPGAYRLFANLLSLGQ